MRRKKAKLGIKPHTRTLITGHRVKDLEGEVSLIHTKSPQKWLCIDLEDGNVWTQLDRPGTFRPVGLRELCHIVSELLCYRVENRML